MSQINKLDDGREKQHKEKILEEQIQDLKEIWQELTRKRWRNFSSKKL